MANRPISVASKEESDRVCQHLDQHLQRHCHCEIIPPWPVAMMHQSHVTRQNTTPCSHIEKHKNHEDKVVIVEYLITVPSNLEDKGLVSVSVWKKHCSRSRSSSQDGRAPRMASSQQPWGVFNSPLVTLQSVPNTTKNLKKD